MNNKSLTLNYFVPPEKFREEEFVDPWTYKYFKERGWTIWRLFVPSLLYAEFNLRMELDVPFTLNTWHHFNEKEWGSAKGCHMWRGYRTPKWEFFSPYTPHLGSALDSVSSKMPAEKIRQFILSHQSDPRWAAITRIEMTKNGHPIPWLHIDCINRDKDMNGIYKLHVGRHA